MSVSSASFLVLLLIGAVLSCGDGSTVADGGAVGALTESCGYQPAPGVALRASVVPPAVAEAGSSLSSRVCRVTAVEAQERELHVSLLCDGSGVELQLSDSAEVPALDGEWDLSHWVGRDVELVEAPHFSGLDLALFDAGTAELLLHYSGLSDEARKFSLSPLLLDLEELSCVIKESFCGLPPEEATDPVRGVSARLSAGSDSVTLVSQGRAVLGPYALQMWGAHSTRCPFQCSVGGLSCGIIVGKLLAVRVRE